MQSKDIEQDNDATTHASKSCDETMNDKRDDARRMAEELIAEEARGAPGSAIKAYLIAAMVGLAFWGVLYFIWRSL